MPEFMPISSRIGPLTTDITANELVLLEHLLHEWPPGDRVGLLDIGAELGCTLAYHGLAYKGLARGRHTVSERHRSREPSEHMGVNRYRRYPFFF